MKWAFACEKVSQSRKKSKFNSVTKRRKIYEGEKSVRNGKIKEDIMHRLLNKVVKINDNKNRKTKQRKAVRDVNRGKNRFKKLLPCRTNFGTNDNKERLSDYKDNFAML